MVRRTILIACASLLAVPVPVAARAASPPRAAAQLNRCHASLDAAQRYAVFGGSMRSLRAGLDRMDMRFDLFRRTPAWFKRVAAPGLGVWNHADPGVGRFKFKQKVENLAAPAAYRAVVSFRWRDAQGRVFARSQHVTPTCQQLDLRPNLRIGHITPQGRTYTVVVRNDGLTAARAFDVSLAVGGAPVVPSQTVGVLGAGLRVTLQFTGPRCTDPVVASADPGGAVSETNESDNQLTVACPAPVTTSSR